jgi:hypothetical protein
MALVTNLSVPNYLHNRRYASDYEAQAPSATRAQFLVTNHDLRRGIGRFASDLLRDCGDDSSLLTERRHPHLPPRER